MSESSAEDLGHSHHNPHIQTDTESSDEQKLEFQLPSQTHTREVLDDVHRVLVQKIIASIKFAWAKYLVVWMHSGLRYYAGINIALNVEWSREVCRCASTR